MVCSDPSNSILTENHFNSIIENNIAFETILNEFGINHCQERRINTLKKWAICAFKEGGSHYLPADVAIFNQAWIDNIRLIIKRSQRLLSIERGLTATAVEAIRVSILLRQSI